ncbi:MAG: PASTA domain-containing protein [Bacteroidales bacterium]|jgi:beta-lactam-binding protein with PASTA domain|nr:PASTA domain-containing protein [Bacteroidales bacterium]
MSRTGFLQKYPWVLHTLIAIAASLLIVVIVFIILKHYGRVGQEYPTPYVVGMNIDELSDQGLGIEYVIIDSIYQQNHKGGYILRQDPDSGSLIKRGRKIYITITASRPESTNMPDLHSLSVRNAISQLENAGLHGGKLIFVNDPHHTVLEQKYRGRTVASGREMERGALVDLVVGRGSGKTQTIVPYLVGMSPVKARRNILSASLNIGSEHYDGISDMSRAIVFRQSPAYTGRSDTEFGSTVEIWYCDKSVVAMEELERMKRRQEEDSLRTLEMLMNGEFFEESSSSQYDLLDLDAF